MNLHVPASALAVLVLAVGASGCGGSSSKSSSSSSTPAPSTTATVPPPLSKASYEQQLGPLLNNRVAPALRALNANGGVLNPSHLKQEISLLETALNKMAALTPPAAVADLHKKAVAALGSTIADVTKLRTAELANDRTAGIAAAKALNADGGRLVAVGSQFTARGY
jgi:hypothetical protein